MSKILNVSITPLDGVHLVEAAAGTGKTYNITAFYLRLIVEKKYKVDQILVVTYTRTATTELRDRIDRRMREALAVLTGDENPDPDDAFLNDFHSKYQGDEEAIQLLSDAIHDLDLAAIHTIHGFCRQVLQEQVFESGSLFDIDFVADDSELHQEVLDDIWLEMINWVRENNDRTPVFDFLVEKIGEPDALGKIMSTVKSNPYLKIKNADNGFDPDQVCARLNQTWKELKAEWNPEEITSFLKKSKFINHNSFKDPHLSNWLEKLSELMHRDSPPYHPEEVFPNFTKFTIDHVESQRNEKNLPKGEAFPHQRFFELCRDLIQVGTDLAEAVYIKLIERYREQLAARKKSRKVRSYDDLLTSLDSALTNQEMKRKLQKQYPAALIDEFQDTDPVQFSIFKKIYIDDGNRQNQSLFLIGDPKQSIYSFRGADIFTYLNAREEVDHNWTLDTNYRSAGSLVDAVQDLMHFKNSHPFLLNEIQMQPIKSHLGEEQFRVSGDKIDPKPLQVLLSHENDELNKQDAGQQAAAATADEIRYLLNSAESIRIEDKPLEAAEIAVLVDSHTSGDKVKKELQKRGIQSVDRSRQSIFQTPEADMLLLFLHAIKEPSDPGLIRALLGSRIGGFTFSMLEKLDQNEDTRVALFDHFRIMNEIFLKNGFTQAWRYFLNSEMPSPADESLIPYITILAWDGGERTLTNLMHLSELITEFTRYGSHGLEDIIKWLRRNQEEAESNEEEELRLESDQDLVKIITMHSAKGLQFPVVFCPFLWIGTDQSKFKEPYLFHKNGSRWMDVIGRDRSSKIFNLREIVSEKLRLAYVALTRAQYRCYISWEPYSSQELSPLTGILLGTGRLEDFIPEPSNSKEKEERKAEKQKVLPDSRDTITALAREGIIGTTQHSAQVQPVQLSDDQNGQIISNPKKWVRGPIDPSWYITSYSGLKMGQTTEPDEPFADEGTEDEPVEKSGESGEWSVFTFPRGARAGIFMHQLFEEVDFTRDRDRIADEIRKQLQLHDFDPGWQQVIEKMTVSALETTLLSESGFTLNKVKPDKCLKEMEFHFSISGAEISEIAQIINGSHLDKDLSEGELRGFMKGFIDLIFEHDGRYYILDYKSDHLGYQPEDYNSDVLLSHIRENGYDIQYHIYTVALMRHLNQRLPDFDYSRHFGGVIYLFLRGAQGKGTGVFFDKPNEQVIHRLNDYFT